MGIRPSLPRRRRMAVVLGVALVAASLGASGSAAGGTAQVVHGAVRVDQVGYATGEAKHAYLMAPSAATGARYAVVDGRGATVLPAGSARSPARGTTGSRPCTTSTSPG